MGYDVNKWKKRLAERSDLSSQVIHLTKGSIEGDKKISSQKNLQNIILERTIRGSDNSGFIVGDKTAVCFQDAPVYAACQNTYFEQKYRESNPAVKKRYAPLGVMFPKSYMFDKGGRPVLYEKTAVAKKLLPKSDWWRIVNFDMSDDNNIIDWTHEREWRCPGNFEFDISQATLLFVNTSNYKTFFQWDSKQTEPVIDKVKGIVVLSDIFY